MEMTEEVYQSLKNILARHPKLKTEAIIDGYSGFILIDKDKHPKVALHIENEMRWAMKKYKKPNAGMDIKTSHASYDRAAEQMAKIVGFHGNAVQEKQRESG